MAGNAEIPAAKGFMGGAQAREMERCWKPKFDMDVHQKWFLLDPFWVIHHWIVMSLISHIHVFNHQQSFARLQLLEMSMESTRC